jgi:ABC-type dipeptide/oligopeptide/nickel transport system permease subunit
MMGTREATQVAALSIEEQLDLHEPISLWRDALNRLLANRLAVVGMVIVLLLFIVAIFGPLMTPYDFLTQDMANRNQPPTAAHWLGTDDLGRDVLSRIIYGSRTATIVAFSVTGVSLAIGILLGSLAGYTGGRLDAFIVWLIDMTMAIPSLLLAVVINVSLKTPITYWMDDMYLQTHNAFFRETMWVDFALVFGALALVMWPPYARLIRGQILSIRNENYVLAAQALGLSRWRVLMRYVIPNALGPVIVQASAGLGQAMVLESAFSFLGVGVRPPIPSWGNMISDGLRVWRHYSYLLAAPAAVLGIVTVAFSFLGDGLNDALNPKTWR